MSFDNFLCNDLRYPLKSLDFIVMMEAIHKGQHLIPPAESRSYVIIPVRDFIDNRFHSVCIYNEDCLQCVFTAAGIPDCLPTTTENFQHHSSLHPIFAVLNFYAVYRRIFLPTSVPRSLYLLGNRLSLDSRKSLVDLIGGHLNRFISSIFYFLTKNLFHF